MQKINIKDIEYIAMGSTVLGTGGGGDPYIGKLFAKEAAIKESIPLAYLPGAVKLKVKLCGDFIS